jgi:hypothetical protein
VLTGGAAALLATGPGQRYMFGQIPGQNLLSGKVRQAVPYVAQAGALLGAQ